MLTRHNKIIETGNSITLLWNKSLKVAFHKMPCFFILCRYNDFKHDPLSHCNCTPPYSGENAISARSDLNPVSGKYPFSALGHRCHGGTDMKVNLFPKLAGNNIACLIVLRQVMCCSIALILLLHWYHAEV